jgi:hypothetical protein
MGSFGAEQTHRPNRTCEIAKSVGVVSRSRLISIGLWDGDDRRPTQTQSQNSARVIGCVYERISNENLLCTCDHYNTTALSDVRSCRHFTRTQGGVVCTMTRRLFKFRVSAQRSYRSTHASCMFDLRERSRIAITQITTTAHTNERAAMTGEQSRTHMRTSSRPDGARGGAQTSPLSSCELPCAFQGSVLSANTTVRGKGSSSNAMGAICAVQQENVHGINN